MTVCVNMRWQMGRDAQCVDNQRDDILARMARKASRSIQCTDNQLIVNHATRRSISQSTGCSADI